MREGRRLTREQERELEAGARSEKEQERKSNADAMAKRCMMELLSAIPAPGVYATWLE